jgi:hypothetical protein
MEETVARRPAVIVAAALALIVVAYLLWWPSLLQAAQGAHGPFGGGPGMHSVR